MKTLIWKGFKVKYNEDEFNNEKDVIDFMEDIYKGYVDAFDNVKTINLTNPDYMFIGKQRYIYYGGSNKEPGRLDYYCKGYFN